jgi:hypothetical protein
VAHIKDMLKYVKKQSLNKKHLQVI